MSDLEAYRAKAAAWCESVAPTFGKAARKGLSVEEDLALGRRYQKAKFDAGFAGINWPTDLGGQGLGHIEKITFEAEEMKHGFPNVYFGISLGMPVPVLMQFGSDRDFVKERVLKALQGEEIWCQLFSEPSGGTDLAGLRTRAETDGNGWKINGQKVWTSWAQYSDYGVIVVRTDPTVAKHKGLTYFWVDMKAPGVTVRPIKLAGGDSPQLCDAFGTRFDQCPRTIDDAGGYDAGPRRLAQQAGRGALAPEAVRTRDRPARRGRIPLRRACLAQGRLGVELDQCADRPHRRRFGRNAAQHDCRAHPRSAARPSPRQGRPLQPDSSLRSLPMKLDSSTAAVVTGGASGLGRATAEALAAAGVKVAIFDINDALGEEVAHSIGGLFVHVDITDEQSVLDGFAKARAAHGQERIAVHCAMTSRRGKTLAYDKETGKFRRTPTADYEYGVAGILTASYRIGSIAAEGMATLPELEDGERGAIIFTASVAAQDAQIGQVIYGSAKAGVNGLVLPMARDLMDLGIRVNSIMPGVFGTPLLGNMNPKVKESLEASVPFPKRLGKAEEYASLAMEMIRNTYFNGQAVRLDGAIRMAPR